MKYMNGCVQCGGRVSERTTYVCCSGRDCACYGAKVPSRFCSIECWDKAIEDEKREEAIEAERKAALDAAEEDAHAPV